MEINQDVTRDLLTRMVEQPEPSVDGDWYAVEIADLFNAGYTHVQFHFDFDVNQPNAASLIKAN